MFVDTQANHHPSLGLAGVSKSKVKKANKKKRNSSSQDVSECRSV